jgi:capsular polysaccharide transport system ATP-binding protein
MPKQGNKMLKLQNVTKFYKIKSKRHYVIRDLSYEFPENTSIAILGANGAGKSTLLRLLGGIELPNTGSIITNKSISWPVGLGSGYLMNLSARENIRFVCHIYNKSRHERLRITEFVYNFAEIGKFFDMPIETYSSGMRGRVNFGLSMAFDFDYYLVDEVTGVGDPFFKKKAAEVFQEKRKKAGILFVSHNIKQIRETCDIGVYLENGKFTVYQDIEEAIKRYQKNKQAHSNV